MANIAIIGYGKMGKEIEKLLLAENHVVTAKIDSDLEWAKYMPEFLKSDVAIEFTTPDTMIENCKRCIMHDIPVVTGTTGCTDAIPELLQFAEKYSGSLVYGSNYSIGANLFFKINEELAALMNSQSQYDVHVEETHHTEKKDKPSGTAITIAQTIIDKLNRKNNWALQSVERQELNIIPHRVEGVPGTHRVIYDSFEDSIEITHTAKNRLGFATGAIKAALWLKDNHGTYHFKDIFHLI